MEGRMTTEELLVEMEALEKKWDDRSEAFSEGAREASAYGIDEKVEHDKCMLAMRAIDRCTNDLRKLRAKASGQ